MRRYWIPKESLLDEWVKLTGDTLHHIRDVCRMRKGSRFEVIVPGGLAFLVEIESESKHESLARVIESRVIPPLPRPHIHLVLSVPKIPVFEAVVEKAVELGVKSIQPVSSDFSFIRTQTDIFDKKRGRFEKIVQSATQQSGRGELMSIAPVVGLENFLQTFNQNSKAVGLFAYEGEATQAARAGIAALKDRKPEDVWIFVGSEGGFSDREVRLFEQFGLKSVTLGAQVLRVETACVALVSIIKYDFDQMQ